MFSSLRFRLWLTYVLVAGVVLVVATLTVGIYLIRNPAVDRREVQRLHLLSTLVSQRRTILNLEGIDLAAPRLQEMARRMDKTLGVRVAVYNASGELLVDSRSEATPALPGWETLSKGSGRGEYVFRDASRRQWLYSLTPLDSGSFLMLAVPRLRTSIVNLLRDEFLNLFLRGALLAVFLSLLLALWIAGWITAPLKRIAESARSLSGREFQKISLEGPNEVKDLASSFNEMGERVQASQRAQRDFVANVSHDLKTPLTSIQGFAQAILDDTAHDPADVQQAAGVIYDEASRMHRMVVDLLELARLDAGAMDFERGSVNLSDVLNGLVQKFSPLAHQRQVDLRLIYHEAGGETPVIVGDADRLAQVFSNLLENALEHTPTAGQVMAELLPGAEWIEVRVVDNGPGIPSDELERIFERFFQTDKARPGGRGRGVGLGLAIARDIVIAHGGTIAAYNRDQGDHQPDDALGSGSGSIFVVRLRAVQPEDSTLVRRKREGAVRLVHP